MLKIWGRRNSQNVQKPMWLLGELGLAHEHVDAGGKFGVVDTPEFRAMNPNGKVPVIQDGELVLWESGAILRYLAAKYGNGQDRAMPRGDNAAGDFWPDDAARRARADQWMEWSSTSLQPTFLAGIFMAYWRTPQAQRNAAVVERGVQATGELLQILDAQLEGKPYVLGDRLSLADIHIGCNLYRYFTIDLPKPPIANVRAYYERLQARPAYAQHVMVSIADMKA